MACLVGKAGDEVRDGALDHRVVGQDTQALEQLSKAPRHRGLPCECASHSRVAVRGPGVGGSGGEGGGEGNGGGRGGRAVGEGGGGGQ